METANYLGQHEFRTSEAKHGILNGTGHPTPGRFPCPRANEIPGEIPGVAIAPPMLQTSVHVRLNELTCAFATRESRPVTAPLAVTLGSAPAQLETFFIR